MSKETFGSNFGGGLGCALVIVAVAIFMSFPAVLEIIKIALTK